ncbi:bacterial low temperature requirement A protein-domain-containing protein [Blakeslea trispora]|nr:bacterial low temperature requirement A protein-domain-containing protein [Blakeslea trispora]
MDSPTNLSSNPSVRRGPTLRGGRFRPPIGKSVRIPRQRDSEDEEESVGLADAGVYENSNEAYEMLEHTEKFETDLDEKPVYHHGEETFGDILTHPKKEFHDHQNRRQSYKLKMNRWSLTHHHTPNSGEDHQQERLIGTEPQHHIDYSLVLHFRQLKGNQRFVLDHDTAEDFCQKLNFTAQEKIRFNGVKDTDGLTDFLYKIKRDFSIKIHHKGDFAHGEPGHHHHHQQHNHPDNHTIEFNDNLYVEFKPKHNFHEVVPVEQTRRPFFQHPEPDLSADIGIEKAASWLELFYDLFFVATLTQFTHSHHIKDWESLGLYAQWFVITWWAWCASSLYTARFDTDDVVHHIYRLIEMCAVIGMAGSSEYFLYSPGYVYGYIALKGVLALEYFVVLIVALLTKSKSRIALSLYVAANLISIALWASSIVILGASIHRILWFLAILIEVLVNVIVRSDKSLSWAASHLAERLGLLSLIVLGENLMGLVSLVSGAGNYLIVVVPNFMAVFIIFGFFFMYFEDFNKEIFLHNKYHQIWVYLHFPLHLCQVAFGISLIDVLKIYKYQLIRDHKLPAEASSAESGSHGAGGESGSHGASGESSSHGTGGESTSHGAATGESTSHGTTAGESSSHETTTGESSSHGAATGESSSHGAATGESSSHGAATGESSSHGTTAGESSSHTTETPEANSASSSSAHHKAKRAIQMTQPSHENDYNPMEMARQIQEEQIRYHADKSSWPTTSDHWTVWCKYLAASAVVSTIHLISSKENSYEHYYPTLASNNQHNHLVRRSGAESSGSFQESITQYELIFVYKTFLIFAGLILILNSMIKALNTKISDLYGKIIICARVINAIVLWSMCALPFAQLDAIVLLCTMTGSLIFQAMVDLLD